MRMPMKTPKTRHTGMSDRTLLKKAAESVIDVIVIAWSEREYATSIRSSMSEWRLAACRHASMKTKMSSTPMPTMTKRAMKLSMPM
eukprot:2787274-Prymnesium_polylepis.1